jgi:hypothetical protein
MPARKAGIGPSGMDYDNPGSSSESNEIRKRPDGRLKRSNLRPQFFPRNPTLQILWKARPEWRESLRGARGMPAMEAGIGPTGLDYGNPGPWSEANEIRTRPDGRLQRSNLRPQFYPQRSDLRPQFYKLSDVRIGKT